MDHISVWILTNTSIENGFSERGRITHLTSEDELKRGYYYGNGYSVKRTFYIDNYLYTYSDSMLKANNLTTLEDISQVEIKSSTNNQYLYEEMMIN